MMTNAISGWEAGSREQAINELRSADKVWDLIVVGGGITGAGVYREAAYRGLSVLLIEQQDFAWGSSSRSSKMVHGGLRYLGSGQFSLAKDSVCERQKLLDELPGLVEPLPFMMEHRKGVFPGPWIFDKLLAIYDWLAGKRSREYIPCAIREFWVPGYRHDVEGMTRFADAVTDDARLVMRCLHDGNAMGGSALNYIEALKPDTQTSGTKSLQVRDRETDSEFSLQARCIVNATGAWTDTLRAALGKAKVIRPLRGSHLAVPFRRLPVSFSVSFLHPKYKRPVFVFPWEGVSVIGTTDLDHKQDMRNEAAITQEEVEYLFAGVNQQFPECELQESDAISSWAGVRPVVASEPITEANAANPSAEKREHVIWDDHGLISIAGGKLTTYRLLALEVLQKCLPYLEGVLAATDLVGPIPFDSGSEYSGQKNTLARAHSKPLQRRLRGRYAKHSTDIASLAQSLQQAMPGTEYLQAELAWSAEHEALVHLDDLMLRRTRLGLLQPRGGQDLLPLIREIVQATLHWSDEHWQREQQRYLEIIQRYYSLPSHSRNHPAQTAGLG